MLVTVLRRGLQIPHIYGGLRYFATAAASRPVPSPRVGSIQSPTDLLASFGRSCETKLKVESWDELWKMGGAGMRRAGVGVKDRRYILWSLEKFRQGHDPADFAHPERPKKKIRGWGPSVQFGKRIRSRRHR
ncbi:hypothetical protein JB92DRAFT_1190612 [Gautieria morchelliformis]|nr:hypothetical protein JB92DRAFT_1190612 [Gautieria morchelliformis]